MAEPDPAILDTRLESTINLCMDYLANEGLGAPNLFRAVASQKKLSSAMQTVIQGREINFVQINDPSLCTGILKECLKSMHKPLFPVHLLQPLAEAQKLSKQDPMDRRHVRMKEVLTAAALAGTVSATFLNLVGLLNLLEQNTAANGTSFGHLAATFAGDFLSDRGSGLAPNSPEWRAATQSASQVMMDLILHIYRMFPPHGEQTTPASSPPASTELANNQKQLLHEADHKGKQSHESSTSYIRNAHDNDGASEKLSFEARSRGDDATPPQSNSSAISWEAFGTDNKEDDTDDESLMKSSETGPSPAATSQKKAETMQSSEDNQWRQQKMNLEDEGKGNAGPDCEVEASDLENASGEADYYSEDDREPVDLVAIAKHSYSATDDDELSFEKGDRIRLTWRSSWDDEAEEGWYTGELRGEIGLLPSTYVEILEREEQEDSSSNKSSPQHKLKDTRSELDQLSEVHDRPDSTKSSQVSDSSEPHAPVSSSEPHATQVEPQLTDDKSISTVQDSTSQGTAFTSALTSAQTPPSSPLGQLTPSILPTQTDASSHSAMPMKSQFAMPREALAKSNHAAIKHGDTSQGAHIGFLDDDTETTNIEVGRRSEQASESRNMQQPMSISKAEVSSQHQARATDERAQKYVTSSASEIALGNAMMHVHSCINDAKVELLFGKSGGKKEPSDKCTKDAWKKALAWYKSGAGTGGGTSPGNSTRAYPGRILASKARREPAGDLDDRASSGSPKTGLRSDTTMAGLQLKTPYENSPRRSGVSNTPQRAMAPRAADPSQYSHSWTRKWQNKILSDSDSRAAVHSGGLSVSEEALYDKSGDKAAGQYSGAKTLTDIEGDMEREKSDALKKVHTIRSSQRSRMKLYNSSLVSATPQTSGGETEVLQRLRCCSQTSGGETSGGDTASLQNRGGGILLGSDGSEKSEYHVMNEGWEVEEDEYKYWTGNAAYRHVERQRKARIVASSRDQWNASGYRRSPPRAESGRLGSAEGLILDMSPALRRAGTADNAKRGISFTSAESGLGRNSSVEQFGTLDWHLQDLFLSDVHTSYEAPVRNVASGPKSLSTRLAAQGSPTLGSPTLPCTQGSPSLLSNDPDPRQCCWLPRPEPLLYAVALVGLPNAALERIDGGCTRGLKDASFLAGPFKPHLLAMQTPKTTTSQDHDTLGKLISAYSMPCGVLIRSEPHPPSKYSVMLPRSGLAPLSLHCHLRYRHEFGTALAVKFGGGGPVFVPECIIVATETIFYDTLHAALSCLLTSLPKAPVHSSSSLALSCADDMKSHTTSVITVVNTGSGKSTLDLLLDSLACDVPPPGMPLYLQIGNSSLHCQRPDPRDLPLADIDFAPLLRALDSRNTARLLMLMLLEPQVVLIADSIEHLFPTVVALMELLYPFVWSFPVVPVLPPSRLSFLDSPHPYIVGVHRSCVPRGRLPSNILVVDIGQNTLTVPPSISCEGLDEIEAIFESRISACKDALWACAIPPGAAQSGERVKSKVIPESVIAPGAWGTASAGNGSSTHAAVETLRLNVAADFSRILFRYPLYLQTPSPGVVFDAPAFVAASDHSAFVRALSFTKMFTGFLNSRCANWLPAAGSGSKLMDVFDANVKRRLETEAQLLKEAEDGDVSGFLFIQERTDGPSEGKWNLKWCELNAKELKAFTFQAPTSASSATSPDDTAMTVAIVPHRTVTLSRSEGRRDPTIFGFEIRIRASGGGESIIRLCAKDKKTRTKWMMSIRRRALGEQLFSKLGLLLR